jgi:cytochrome b6-f complex iron-sulfur subunit
MNKSSRRDFLKLSTNALLTAAGLLGLGGLLRFLSYESDAASPTEFDIGPASNYPLNSRTLMANIPAMIIHDQGGIQAIHLICTHLGCTAEEVPDGFTCPCHGSHFDRNGLVLQGPASKPLKRLKIKETEAGTLQVYTT